MDRIDLLFEENDAYSRKLNKMRFEFKKLSKNADELIKSYCVYDKKIYTNRVGKMLNS
jgi:hypothetical protein